MSAFLSSELTLNAEGKLYHLAINENDIADTIILVGDPERVQFIRQFFDKVLFTEQNREFTTVTGTYNRKKITVLSTGIGTDNIDIVLNELDAAVNIDLIARKVKDRHKSLNLIRIGTCGALRDDINVGEIIRTKYAVGMDGLMHHYAITYTDDELEAKSQFNSITGWSDFLNPVYIKSSNQEMEDLFSDVGLPGITLTANGFYGPQGRALRIPLKFPQLHERLRLFKWQGVQLSNLEMETSGLYAMSSALGHKAITLCLVVANRSKGTFLPNYTDEMKNLVVKVLSRLTK
jgi:uridine phosphorylase